MRDTCLCHCIEFIVWHLLCGGPLLVTARLLYAVIYFISCDCRGDTSFIVARQHLKIALYGLCPMGRTLIYVAPKIDNEKDCCLFNQEICMAINCVVGVALYLIQIVCTGFTYMITCGQLSRYWNAIWDVTFLDSAVEIVYRSANGTGSAERSQSFLERVYDPNQKCKVSLRSSNGYWLCPEHGAVSKVSCYIVREIEARTFVSHPIGDGKVMLSSEQKWLVANPDGSVHLMQSDLLQPIFVVFDADTERWGFRSADNGYLSEEDCLVRWDKDEFGENEKFKVEVLEIMSGDTDTSQATTPLTVKAGGQLIQGDLSIVTKTDIQAGSD